MSIHISTNFQIWAMNWSYFILSHSPATFFFVFNRKKIILPQCHLITILSSCVLSSTRYLSFVKPSPWSASSRWWPTRTRRTAATSRRRRAASTTTSPRTWPVWSSWRKASGPLRRRSTPTHPTTRETTGTKTTVLSTWTAWRLTCKCAAATPSEKKKKQLLYSCGAKGPHERRDKNATEVTRFTHFLPSETEREALSGWARMKLWETFLFYVTHVMIHIWLCVLSCVYTYLFWN